MLKFHYILEYSLVICGVLNRVDSSRVLSLAEQRMKKCVAAADILSDLLSLPAEYIFARFHYVLTPIRLGV